MKKKYSTILVTKLSPITHSRLQELAKKDRRTLSSISRNIIEDYIETRKDISVMDWQTKE